MGEVRIERNFLQYGLDIAEQRVVCWPQAEWGHWGNHCPWRDREPCAERIARMKMLLGEDNRGDVHLIREALRTSPVLVEMDHVTDGEQLLAHLRHQGHQMHTPRPDLIVLDLSMPHKDGWEVLRELRGMPEFCDIPLVVFTGVLTRTIAQQLAALGVVRTVQKPMDLHAYTQAIHEMVRWWQQHHGLPTP